MRYRRLDSNGDYTFGQGSTNFLINSPATVAQAVSTALRLFQGEWFLDITAGVPWITSVAGVNTRDTADSVVKQAILGVTGVLNIVSYSSSFDTAKRIFSVTATINTQFGVASVNTDISGLGYGVGGYGEHGYGV
jgi:hypothetical protein